MGWFDEQIEYRKKHEKELLTDSFDNIYRSITGRRVHNTAAQDANFSDAAAQMLKYFGIREKEIPLRITSFEDRLDYVLSGSGVMYRRVTLEKGWHADAMGVLITALEDDGTVITALPGSMGGYVYTDPKTGRHVKVTEKNEKLLCDAAWCFYRPFPQRKMTNRDLFLYIRECLNSWDLVSFALAAMVITVVGLLIPPLSRLMVGKIAGYGDVRLLTGAVAFLACAAIGRLMFSLIRSMLLTRISTKVSVSVQAAAMMRVLSLPADFFKQYSSGELNRYLSYLNSLSDILVNTALSAGITGIFSLAYLAQIFAYARPLVVPSIFVTCLTLAVSLIAGLTQLNVNREKMTLSAKNSGLVYALISGIQKLRLSGAENRAFVKWSNQYAQEASLTYNLPVSVRMSGVITMAISLLGTGIMYYTAVQKKITAPNYYAFSIAYGYFTAAFTQAASVLLTAAAVKPSLKIIKPFLDAEPEQQSGRETLTDLSGGIELAHVSFRYEEDAPMILDDLSLSIPAYQYVAIAGMTGCGKSTLMRLLLGFEKPIKGAVYYDRKDLQSLDMHSVRRLIGSVMQDGRIFGGTIFENITVSMAEPNLEDAWSAAETAGLADDIRAMPMGMNTILQEGAGGISGGQRQRLLIARAVAANPRILLLDEATSALDNITQKKVSEALDKMHCTRIVIAHRLSTIRTCDRILVLDKGKIIEDGTYDELIEKNGFFAELVARQQIGTTA